MPTIGAPIRNLSRAEAKARGLKRYFDGVPCPSGHLSDKLVSNYTCIKCLHEKHLARRKTSRSQQRAEYRNRLRGNSPLPATKAQAKALGLKKYFTGVPCRRGHIAPRHASGAGCTQCLKEDYGNLTPEQISKERRRRTESARAVRARNPSLARSKVRHRYHTDIQAKLRSVIRHRIKQALRGKTKHTSALVYLGCTILELRAHLEKQFLPGMTWDNHCHGGWHVDHKIPLASFDMTDEEQRRKAFHYTNLQPLWATHNQIKSKRLLTSEQLAELMKLGLADDRVDLRDAGGVRGIDGLNP